MANPNPMANWKGRRRNGGPGRPKGSVNKLTREDVERELRILAMTNTAALGVDASKLQERGPDGQPMAPQPGMVQ